MRIPENIDSKLIMQGVHLDLTDAMKETIREKFAVILRHNEFIVRLNLRLQLDQATGQEHHYKATAQIEISGPDLVATAQGKNAYEVLDELVGKLNRLMERRHGLRKQRRNHPHGVELDASIPKAD